MIRPHLIIRPDPQVQNTDQQALCGVVVPQAVWIPLEDERPEQTRNMCRKCLDVASALHHRGFYYAVISGQESIVA